MILRAGQLWSRFVYRNALAILLMACIATVLAVRAMSGLGISTNIEALMPQGTKSVQTLNDALRKTGSFASIQIVATSDDPDQSLDFIKTVKADIEKLDWVESAQYEEDVSVLEEHKLLLLSEEQLLELERDINQAYPTVIAKQLS